MNSENPSPALPSEGRGRTFESYRVRHAFQALSDKFQPAQTGQNRTKPVYRVTVLARIGGRVAGLFLAAALAFDPHVLLLSWSTERQERSPPPAAHMPRCHRCHRRHGRWLADDPPAAMGCGRGSVFAPGWDCIDGFNCETQR